MKNRDLLKLGLCSFTAYSTALLEGKVGRLEERRWKLHRQALQGVHRYHCRLLTSYTFSKYSVRDGF